MSDVGRIIYEMRRGAFDEAIDEILRIAQERIKVNAGRLAQHLKPGDDIRIKNRADPAWLNGVTGEVIEVKRECVTMELHEGCGSYKPLQRIEVPLSLVELVYRYT